MMIQNIRCRSRQLLASSSSQIAAAISYPSLSINSGSFTNTMSLMSSPVKKSFLSVTSNNSYRSLQQRTPQFDKIFSSPKLSICGVTTIGSKIQNCTLSPIVYNVFQRCLSMSSMAYNNDIAVPIRSSLSAKSLTYINTSVTNNRVAMNTTTSTTSLIIQKRMKHTLKANSSVSKRFRTRRGKGGIHTLVRGRSGAQHNTGYKSRSKSNFLGTSTTIKNKKINAKMKRCMQLN